LLQVLAGLDDGSVCAWDLREGAVPHREVARHLGNDDSILRSPTFVSSSDDSHTSRVTAIKALPVSDAELTGLDDLATSSGSLPIFQVNI
jgi:hypothetical protein